MDNLDRIETESLFGMLKSDLKSCIDEENESWGKEEYQSLLHILNELEIRFNLGRF